MTIGACHLMSKAAGNSASTQSSAFGRSRRDPASASAAPDQNPALSDRANAPRGLSPRGRYTVAALAATLIQQPRKTPSSQRGGTGARAIAIAVTASATTLDPQARRGADASARPSVAPTSA